MSLQCSKVSILLLEKDRHWLIQLAYAVSQKFHVIEPAQGEGLNASLYEGYKHNGIAQAAIGSGECVIVSNVNANVGYDSRLDSVAGIHGVNCLAAPIMTGETKSSNRCVGVLFATNKKHGNFLGVPFLFLCIQILLAFL
jgi:hypothetical protein